MIIGFQYFVLRCMNTCLLDRVCHYFADRQIIETFLKWDWQVLKTAPVAQILFFNMSPSRRTAPPPRPNSIEKEGSISTSEIIFIPRRVGRFPLTHSSLETPKDKQWRPWSDAAERGVWSGSPLFANRLVILSLGISKSNGLTYLKKKFDTRNV